MKWRRVSSIRRVVAKANFPEDRIMALVESGVLKKIAEKAIRHSKALGLPVTIVEDNVLYRIMPDGKRVTLKRLQPVRSSFKRGQVFSIKAAS